MIIRKENLWTKLKVISFDARERESKDLSAWSNDRDEITYLHMDCGILEIRISSGSNINDYAEDYFQILFRIFPYVRGIYFSKCFRYDWIKND